MNDDFAPFELAVKLKEKGFNVPCYGYYHCNGGNDSFELCGNGDRDFLNSKNLYRIAAPTISQVLKWLREEKKIYIEIFLYDGKYSTLVKDITRICDDLFHKCLNEDADDENCATYEQAALAGIEYVLDNLI